MKVRGTNLGFPQPRRFFLIFFFLLLLFSWADYADVKLVVVYVFEIGSQTSCFFVSFYVP